MRADLLVAVGHSRDAASRALVTDFLARWPGEVLVVVSWPERAASWLRQARRLAAGQPDAWVVASTVDSWWHVRRRLCEQPGWDPARTYLLHEGAVDLS
ncbi:hypothetical protein [Kutzneria albida]|uniref:Uncharacterized protein n=1 Tax=Kutzneria albida DSM 43870 TaxID=1449976 RepID=W5WH29_9PSEU|nr:hypothetical protein KALB_6542 [Kutzneria albida DSM 43870]